jgi:hypothetical protein
MKLKGGDWGILVLTLLVISLFAAQVYSEEFSTLVVSIESDGEKWVYPIDQGRTVSFDGPLGETVVEIEDDMVRIKDSPCPDHICVFRGWMKHSGEFAACLPNRVIVSVEGHTHEDIDDLDL